MWNFYKFEVWRVKFFSMWKVESGIYGVCSTNGNLRRAGAAFPRPRSTSLRFVSVKRKLMVAKEVL